MLQNIQSKYDFSPKEQTQSGITGPGSPTTACDNVCRSLLEVANCVRTHQVKAAHNDFRCDRSQGDYLIE